MDDDDDDDDNDNNNNNNNNNNNEDDGDEVMNVSERYRCLFFREQSGRSVKQTTHLELVDVDLDRSLSNFPTIGL